MKLKSLVLGSAAGALAVTGAQAADLGVVPEPIDYVRVCDAFGPGYYFIPGTDTCLRVAGRVRVDYSYFDFDDDFVLPSMGGAFGTADRGSNAYRFRARAYLYMDSRTNTEFGLLRTFTEVYWTGDSGAGGFFGDQSLGTAPGVTLNRAFIQFGGLTFGRTQSFYDFLDATFGSAEFFNADYSDTTTNLAAYTFAFGNGFSASISVEDEDYRRSGITQLCLDRTTFGFFGTSFCPALFPGYAGNRYPDIVGNIRVDQGWGSAQIMAAGHNVQNVIRPADSEYGWAVGGGIAVNVPFGTGTRFGVQGGYTKGALEYVASGAIGGPRLFGPGSAFSTATDAVVVAPDGIFGDISLELVKAWSVSGGFSTAITPTIGFGVQVGYLNVDQADGVLFRGPGFTGFPPFVFGGVDVQSFSGDFNNFDVDAYLSYKPVSGMEFGLGAQYKYVDPDSGGNYDGLTTFFRAQRTF